MRVALFAMMVVGCLGCGVRPRPAWTQGPVCPNLAHDDPELQWSTGESVAAALLGIGGVKLGTTRDEMFQLLGEPHAAFRSRSGELEDWAWRWDVDGYGSPMCVVIAMKNGVVVRFLALPQNHSDFVDIVQPQRPPVTSIDQLVFIQ